MSLEFAEYGVVGPLGVYDKGLLVFDGFESVLFKWDKAGTGADYEAGRDTSMAYNGEAGAKLRTRATGAAAGDYVQMSRTFTYPYRGKIWFRIRFRWDVGSRISTFMVQINIYNGVKHRRAALRYVVTTQAFEYLNTVGGWSSIAAMSMEIPDGGWQELTFALDLVLNQYVEAHLSGKYADMRTIGYYEVAVNTTRQANVVLYLDAADANRPYIFLDDVMVGEHVML